MIFQNNFVFLHHEEISRLNLFQELLPCDAVSMRIHYLNWYHSLSYLQEKSFHLYQITQDSLVFIIQNPTLYEFTF